MWIHHEYLGTLLPRNLIICSFLKICSVYKLRAWMTIQLKLKPHHNKQVYSFGVDTIPTCDKRRPLWTLPEHGEFRKLFNGRRVRKYCFWRFETLIKQPRATHFTDIYHTGLYYCTIYIILLCIGTLEIRFNIHYVL